MKPGTVIVGTGQGGFQTAASLRAEGYKDSITLIGDEPHIPYYRPPLSKAFMTGEQDRESLDLRPANFYRDHQIELVPGEKVVAINRPGRQVHTQSGREFSYGKLVLAVGARNRTLPVKGADLDGVLYLRTVDESEKVRQRLAGATDVVVIGGGFIGLELAAVASKLGKSVTVIEALPRLMSRAVAPIVSDFFYNLHCSHSVRVLCGSGVTEIVADAGKVAGVKTNDGTLFPAEVVLVGIGVVPNVELAREAGLQVGNGITVNEFLQTSDPDIYAIGDCVEHPCVQAGARMRLESVQNAADQAQCVALGITGKPSAYHELPWFWTDQYDIKLQMAGISQGHDHVVTRGDASTGKMSVFYFKQGRLIAIDSINRPMDHMLGRKLLSAGATITPEQAADETFELKKFVQGLQKPQSAGVHP